MPSDLGDHQSDPGAIGETPQIDRCVLPLIDPGNYPGNHAGVQRGAVPVHQDHRPTRSPLRFHGPAAEQKGMAVAATGQHRAPSGMAVVMSRFGIPSDSPAARPNRRG